MDEQILKSMPDYVQKLPLIVRDTIFDGEWKNRTEEIASKYSLTPDQTDTLVDKVLFVLIGVESGDDFLEGIIAEINISRLLAEQIMNELTTRVFEYFLKQIGKPQSNLESNINSTDTTIQFPTPDLPMVEPGEIAHDVPRSQESFQTPAQVTEPLVSHNPISVPRYIPPADDMTIAPPSPVTTQSPVQNTHTIPVGALTRSPVRDTLPQNAQATQPKTNLAPDNLPGIEIIPERRNGVDPYREPLN